MNGSKHVKNLINKKKIFIRKWNQRTNKNRPAGEHRKTETTTTRDNNDKISK